MKFRIFFVMLFFTGLVGAAVYNHYASDLSLGTFNNTLYNSTGKNVYLNYTDSTNTSFVENGTYISPVIDLGSSTGFVEMKWQGNGSCPGNMSYINKLGGYCIDSYEASKPDANSTSAGSNTSFATSKPNVLLWVSVSQTAARTACQNAGKHLCTSEEWLGAANIKAQIYYLPSGAASGTRIPSNSSDNSACVTYSQCTPCTTGSHTDCISAEGVYDLIGNVWEWVNETVDTIKTCNSGSSGWCYANSTGGWQTTGDTKYGSDGVYFLANSASGRAVVRGGSWEYGADAGLFAASVYGAPSGSGANVGFRCCSSSL
jgi:hypothetical protein